MTIVKNFFYCLSLRSGGIILGVFTLASALYGLAAYAITLVAILSMDSPKTSDHDKEMDSTTWMIIILCFGISLLFVISSAMLLNGSLKVSFIILS